MAEMASIQAFVHGHVQGVFFRASVESKAAALNITGFVRNRPGGSVEVVAEGEKTRLEELVAYLNVGPPAARVTDVKTVWVPYTGEYTGFRIR